MFGRGGSRKPASMPEHFCTRYREIAAFCRSSNGHSLLLDEEDISRSWTSPGRARAALSMLKRVTKAASTISSRLSTKPFPGLHWRHHRSGRSRMVCLADAQPPDVHLLHAEKGVLKRLAGLSARPACDLPEGKGRDKSFIPAIATFCCACFTKGLGSKGTKSRDSTSCSGQFPTSTAACSRSIRSKSVA